MQNETTPTGLSQRRLRKCKRIYRRLDEYYKARDAGDYRRTWSNPTSKYKSHAGVKQLLKKHFNFSLNDVPTDSSTL